MCVCVRGRMRYVLGLLLLKTTIRGFLAPHTSHLALSVPHRGAR